MKTPSKPPGKSADAPRYDVHPAVKMVQNWVASLKGKTGRSKEEWLAFIQKSGPKTALERVAWLKEEHGLGTNSAAWLVDRAEGKGSEEDTPEGYLRAAPTYIEQQYSGKKAALRPIYNELIRLGKELGRDVRICPCTTLVPLFRHHVFAQIKPSSNTRVDLGLALGNRPATGRLIDTGGFAKKDRITHRIPLSSLQEIDTEVGQWLNLAYESDVK